MTRIGILVLLATILMGFVHLGWNYSGIDSLQESMNKLQMELDKLRRDLQIEGILPYGEEDDYWKSYDESTNPCVESIHECI